MNKIDKFQGPTRWLSNYWTVDITYDGIRYTSTEAAYQASKSLDPEERKIIAKMSPAESKKAGQKVSMRPDWDEVKIQVMEDITRLKFQHEGLKRMLLDTGDAELIEGNTWGDRFWGTVNGEGQNWLGKTLMKIRAELKI